LNDGRPISFSNVRPVSLSENIRPQSISITIPDGNDGNGVNSASTSTSAADLERLRVAPWLSVLVKKKQNNSNNNNGEI
jgi:hypothetical protein